MRRLSPLAGLFPACLALAIASSALAGCMSDCHDEYESEVQNCSLIWTDPDDAFMLTSCIDDAQSEHEDCVEECTS